MRRGWIVRTERSKWGEESMYGLWVGCSPSSKFNRKRRNYRNKIRTISQLNGKKGRPWFKTERNDFSTTFPSSWHSVIVVCSDMYIFNCSFFLLNCRNASRIIARNRSITQIDRHLLILAKIKMFFKNKFFILSAEKRSWRLLFRKNERNPD